MASQRHGQKTAGASDQETGAPREFGAGVQVGGVGSGRKNPGCEDPSTSLLPASF